MSIGSQIIYKQLLQRHGRIRVPMIQRDYAQGRPEETEVRDEFLEALQDALSKPADDPTLPLNLDFIYGSVEGEEETRFLPLDGQQRLTTLFLLHWYLAWKDDQWAVFEQLFQADGHARFDYDVRQSSKEFFDQLVNYRPSVRPEEVPDLAQLITDQPWYFRRWRLDPTVQAVIFMLDAIHAKFVSKTGLFLRLIDESQPAITFQLLDLEHFGLSDDLYIKMNARGKPLTAFETFKARYEQELENQLVGRTFDIAGQQFCVKEYVARRMDTAWTDLFWKLRDTKSNLYDHAFMNVFRAVALITRRPDNTEYTIDVDKLRDKEKVPSYTDFHSRGWLDELFTLTVIRLLDSWSAGSGSLSLRLPDARYFDEKSFFSEVSSKGATLFYGDIVQFAAYVGFIVKHHDSIDSNAFQEWMRIIHNLSVNTVYHNPDDFRRSIHGLNGLLANSGDVLRHFAQPEKAVVGFNEQQIAEEKLKAELILAHDAWMKLIDRAESHGYFRGQIGFLLDFCGVVAARNESELKYWNSTDHETLQESFLNFLFFAEKMFSAKGLEDPGEYRWQRALLSIGDYLLPRGSNYCFLVNFGVDDATWKRLLRGTGYNGPQALQILKQLWESLSQDKDLAEQLDSIIDESHVLEPWRETIVHCPEVFSYCEHNNIRKYSSDTIYLLKRYQTNGAHAELFTYCLQQKLMSRENYFTILKSSYESVLGTYEEPHIRLNCSLQGQKVMFELYYESGNYLMKIEKTKCDEVANLGDTLKTIGFFETDYFFQIQGSPSDIETLLQRLDETLKSEFNNEVCHV